MMLAERGFTLIEVLVALLIIAIGVLGITALQLKGLQYNQDAQFRTQVSILAYDIADRIRLNAGNADDYVTELGNYVVPATEPGGCVQTGTSAVGVTNDLKCWTQQLYQALPPGSTASINNNGGSTYTVAIGWFDRRSESVPRTIPYTFQL